MRLDALKRRVENSAERLRGQMIGKMEKMHLRLRALAGRLDAVSPLQVLGRGYSLTKVLSDSGTGKLVFDASEVASGQRLETTVAKGTIISVVV
jgi:exodeoxyribonuclease VII large subunit